MVDDDGYARCGSCGNPVNLLEIKNTISELASSIPVALDDGNSDGACIMAKELHFLTKRYDGLR